MRETKINKTELKPIDPKDTYDPTTPQLQVYARRTDPHIDAGSPNKANVEALTSFANNMNDTLRLYSAYKKSQEADEEAEGMAARARGTAREEIGGKSEAFIRGYEKLEGKVDALSKLNAEAAQFYETNKDLPPDELNNKFSELVMKKYVDGKSTNYIRGLLPEALATLEQMNKNHSARIAEVVNEKLYQNVNEDTSARVQRELQSTLGMTIPDIMFNYKKRLELENNRQILDTVFPTQVRKVVSEQLEELTAMGIPRREAGFAIARSIANMAEKWGLPELIKYAEVPDEHGQAIINNPKLQEYLTGAVVRATSAHESILRGLHAKEKQEIEDNKNILTNGLIVRIGQANGNMEALQSLKAEITSPDMQKQLDNHFPALYERIETAMANGGTFATHTNGQVRAMLMQKGERLSHKDVMDNLRYLSVQDADHFVSFLETVKNRNQGNALANDFRAFQGVYSSFQSIYRTDDVGRFIDPTNGVNATSYFWKGVQDYQAKHGMKPPTGAALDELMQNTMSKFPTVFMGTKESKEADAQTAAKTEQKAKAPKIVGVTVDDLNNTINVNKSKQSKDNQNNK